MIDHPPLNTVVHYCKIHENKINLCDTVTPFSNIAIWIGGKNSNARSKPSFHKLVASNVPNNPPRWPEAGAIVKKILSVYKEDARDWERVGEWVERIGWPAFFEKTGLPFTKFHINDWKGSRHQLNASAHIRF